MLRLARCWIASLLLPLSLQVPAQPATPEPAPIGATPLRCPSGGAPVREEGFVRIGGIEQWVTVEGADCRNPVLLMVHGGPGNPLSPYADPPSRAWMREFTVVHWDQRGAGRTYGRNPVDPESAERLLTIALLAADGNEVASFAARHLGARKLILFGSSWGSALAVHMAKSRPELYLAYVGTGQLVQRARNDQGSYRKLLARARAAGDTKTLATLEALGEPPWTNPRAPGQLRRATRVYEAMTTDPAPEAWLERAPRYATPERLAEYRDGEDFSWLQYVGYRGDGMQSTLDLEALGLDFALPVFMIQGTEDLVTVPEVAKAYFDAIRAPRKEFFLIERTGHDPNPAMVETQYRVLKTRVLPLLGTDRP